LLFPVDFGAGSQESIPDFRYEPSTGGMASKPLPVQLRYLVGLDSRVICRTARPADDNCTCNLWSWCHVHWQIIRLVGRGSCWRGTEEGARELGVAGDHESRTCLRMPKRNRMHDAALVLASPAALDLVVHQRQPRRVPGQMITSYCRCNKEEQDG
jgi:hypothetical protein